MRVCVHTHSLWCCTESSCHPSVLLMNRKGVMSAFVASLHRHNGGVVVALCSCSCLSVTWLRPLCFKMALSLVGKRLVLPQLSRAAFLSTTASSAVASKPSAPAPSVKDVIVDLTFIDPSGARRKVPGLVGELYCDFCGLMKARNVAELTLFSFFVLFRHPKAKRFTKFVKCTVLILDRPVRELSMKRSGATRGRNHCMAKVQRQALITCSLPDLGSKLLLPKIGRKNAC